MPNLLVPSGDVIVASTIVKAEFWSGDNLKGMVGGALHSSLVSLGANLGFMLLSKLLGLKSQAEVQGLKLDKISEDIKKLKAAIEDRNLADKLEKYRIKSIAIRAQCKRVAMDLAAPSTGVVDFCDKFSMSSAEESWERHLFELNGTLTGHAETDSFFKDLTKSTLATYSEKLIERTMTVKDYVETLSAFLLHFAKSVGQIPFAVRAAATFARDNGRMTDAVCEERIQRAEKTCAQTLNKVGEHFSQLHPTAFRLFSTLWVEKKSLENIYIAGNAKPDSTVMGRRELPKLVVYYGTQKPSEFFPQIGRVNQTDKGALKWTISPTKAADGHVFLKTSGPAYLALHAHACVRTDATKVELYPGDGYYFVNLDDGEPEKNFWKMIVAPKPYVVIGDKEGRALCWGINRAGVGLGFLMTKGPPDPFDYEHQWALFGA